MRSMLIIVIALVVTGASPALAQLPVDYTTRLEARLGEQTHVLTGAGIGLAAGAGAAYLLLYSGGSTSRCDRDANQDALNRRECVGLVAAGGVVGAALGALVGSRIRRGSAGHRHHREVRRAPAALPPAPQIPISAPDPLPVRQ